MTPSPIRKVLSTMRSYQVQYLLMGGQACVFYGAAEFSRDTDLVITAKAENLQRLSNALDELQAKPIAVPPFSAAYLKRGHAVHFRCQCSEARGMRIDIMSVMRGVANFTELWQRRTTLQTVDGEIYELLALPDLVKAKKTQRDKDWLMIRRLMEAHYFALRNEITHNRVRFWLRELRTALLLIETAMEYFVDLLESLYRTMVRIRCCEKSFVELILNGNVRWRDQRQTACGADQIYEDVSVGHVSDLHWPAKI